MTTRFCLVLAAGLLLAAAPAARADIIFNDGATHIITTAQTDRVSVSNNTTVIFNSGGNITPVTANLDVQVVDTSTVTNNAGVFTATKSGSGSAPAVATGISAGNHAVVTMSGGSISATATGTGTARASALGIQIGSTSPLSTISGGTVSASATSAVNASAFAVEGFAGGIINITGGTFSATASGPTDSIGAAIDASNNGQVNIFGGHFSGTGTDGASGAALFSVDGGVITLFGSNFNFPYGPVSPTSGTITGTLQDGTAVSLPFLRGIDDAPAGEIVLAPPQQVGGGAAVPEPSALLLFGLGLAGAAGWRWRRRRAA